MVVGKLLEQLLRGSDRNLLEDTGTECCHGSIKGSKIIKSRVKVQSAVLRIHLLEAYVASKAGVLY